MVPNARLHQLAIRSFAGFLLALVCAVLALGDRPQAQGQGLVAGRNVNMVSGREWPNGDPYLQRQNEPSVAASTRNPLHLLGGANDYRTVDMPFPPDGELETGDAWVGLFKSFDGGQRWISNLVPGYPQDTTPSGIASPLKGYNAAADPVVRAGTHGLFYYSGLVFDRGDTGKSAVFVARYIDNNNKENGDPIVYLGTSLAASDPGTTSRFLDKPWIAVDMPRYGAATCTITTPGEDGDIVQHIPAGTVYVAYTAITGEGATLRAEILFTRSLDCGQTWSPPVRVSRAEDPVNQGATIAIDPRTGSVYVAWRRFSPTGTEDQDAIMVARSVTFGRKWLPPGVARRFPRGQKVGLMLEKFFEHRKPKSPVEIAEIAEYDQVTSEAAISFRTNGYPAIAVDDRGRLYAAWSERGFATTLPSPIDGDARVLIATSPNGTSWTTPRVAEERGQPGHQIMPSIAVTNGKVLLVYYDLLEDRSQVFRKWVDDRSAFDFPVEAGKPRRHTIDLRATMAAVGSAPVFSPSVRVSEYKWGFRNATGPYEQLQVNAPNLPMFKQGTVPFFGDYVDLAAAPSFVPLANGQWTFTLDGTAPPVFHAVWTDNRDVRPPSDGDWTKYTPPNSPARPANSRIDGSPLPPCEQAFAATRNQNVYTARLTSGLLVGSPGNAKPLDPTLQRAFVVFAHNTTNQIKSFRLTIVNQPPGGRASFEQFPLPPYNESSPLPVTTVDVTTAPRSLAARTVYVTSTDPDAQVTVTVVEISAAGGSVVAGGLTGRILLNPDVENPDVENPDVENPDVENPDVENAEVYTPDVENPDVENPDVENPDVENPDVENPDVENVNVANPDVENPDVENPDVENPDVENPDVENPDVENPDVENGTISDVSWQVTNNGNTTAAYNVDLFLTSGAVPPGIKVQLILHKLYKTPVSHNCDLKFETQNVLVANIKNPTFLSPNDPNLPDPNSPDVENATLWLGPGESAKITLRIYDPDKSNNVIINGASIDPAFVPGQVSVGVAQESVNSEDAQAGMTSPPVITPSGSTIFFIQQPTDTRLTRSIQPFVRVQVRDNTGAVVPGALVNVALGSNPGGATLSGYTEATSDLMGIATFDALQLDRVGLGYTLLASASGSSSPPAFSTPFAVFDACAADGVARLQHYIVDGPDLPAGPIALAGSGDFDGDGFADPVVLTRVGTGGYFTIMTNSGMGAFRWTYAAGGSGTGPAAVAVGDFNADGRPDIAIANELSDNLSLLLGRAGSPPVDAPITIGVTDGPASLATGDFDRDGYVDLAAGGDGARVTILRGGPSGLTPWFDLVPYGVKARGLAVADFNGDNWPDLAVADPGTSGVGTVWVYYNSGTGTFGTPAQYNVGESFAIVAADFNGDAKPDLAVGNLNGEVRVLTNDGTGEFTSSLPTELPTQLRSIAAGDFDADGDQDVAVAPGVIGENRFFLLLGDGAGALAAPTELAAGPSPWDVLVGDFNKDGRTDLAIANNQPHDLYDTDTWYLTMSVLLNDCNTKTADVGVTYTLPPNPSPIGENATYVTTVTNDGPFPATSASLVQTVTASGTAPTFVSVTPSAGSCSGTNPITCDLGTLASGEAATVTLVVTPTSTGTLASSWVAQAGELDTHPADNIKSASITVYEPLIVTNVNDNGPGSLRQAILTANARAGLDAITFAIPGPPPYSIALTSDALPFITDAVTIDGTTQPGFAGTPVIELNGSALPGGAPGLRIGAATPGSVVRGLVINRFASGIVIMNGGGGITIAGNYIGTDLGGSVNLGRIATGVSISNAPNNVIGGVGAADRNLISGSLTLVNAAVDIQGALAVNNRVIGNYIGTTADGLTAFPDTSFGIIVTSNATGTIIERNLIAGQQQGGVSLSSGTGHIVRGNLIGVDVNGEVALPNGTGISVGSDLGAAVGALIGGGTAADRNVISGNTVDGVTLRGTASGTIVKGNFIGTNAAGTSAIPNGNDGVRIAGGSNNVVGGTTPGEGNVISGNAIRGVGIYDYAGNLATGNVVAGNLIGTNATGDAAVPNTFNGVGLWASGNTIGGGIPGARNVISGNGNAGIYIQEGTGNTADNNKVQGNFIGTNSAGTAALPNASGGVFLTGGADNLIGGSVPGQGNLISGNGGRGIAIYQSGPNPATGNVVAGNYIGTNAGGTAALANTGDGITIGAPSTIVGGTTAAARNVISGNTGTGLSVQGASNNLVSGNYIGTNPSGSAAIPNSIYGVSVGGGSGNTIEQNVISGNNINLTIQGAAATGNIARGNYIGTTADGLSKIDGSTIGVWICYGASGNTIGGTTLPADRNIISGNGAGGLNDGGIYLCAPNNTVAGNYIGLNVAGGGPIPNASGIRVGAWSGDSSGNVIGGLVPGAFNRIYGNTGAGVAVIGDTASATSILGNTIESNGGAGVVLSSWAGAYPTNVPIAQNSIHSNGWLGIDLGADGVTANDASDLDSGPNDLMNYPGLMQASVFGGSTTVTGVLNSVPGGIFRIEFFVSPTCDASGYGEGQQYLGSVDVTANDSGIASFKVPFAVELPVGYQVTATSTLGSKTSEFSACVAVTAG